MRGRVSPVSTLFFKFSFSCTNIMNQNISSKGRGEYVSLIEVYWFNGNKSQAQTSKKKKGSFKRFKTMHIKNDFSHFKGFEVIFVFLDISGVFWSFQRFGVILVILKVSVYFFYPFRGFKVFLVVLEVLGVLVIFQVLEVFWSFLKF